MSDQNWLQRLTKSKKDKWIGGVCGGLGMFTPIPSWTWRLLFTVLFLCGGAGFVIYVLLWIFLPKEPEQGVPS